MAAMGSRHAHIKTEQLADMDSFFDFNQGTTAQSSPATATTRTDATPKMAAQDWNAMQSFDQPECQQFSGPSHDYNQYKQQVGLPVGTMANMPSVHQGGMFDGYNSGMGDINMDGGFNAGWSSGIDMDSDMSMDFNNPQSTMAPMFFPPAEGQNDSFVNPNTIGGHEEPTSHVGRLWPGMHSQQAQQAAMQKAQQAQAVQQRQMKLQSQQAAYRQAANAPKSQAPMPQQPQQQAQQQQAPANGKRPSHAPEQHVEESISRLLNQMRHNSTASGSDDAGSPSGSMLPHIARMKKDEEEMDEDERLLASEEGKKLSSKERRQLRNKVSARAFRSRRKEYISQLEGEVAMKTQEANEYRTHMEQLQLENERYRSTLDRLLRHQAFMPFVKEFQQGTDASSLGLLPPSRPQQPQSVTPSQASSSQVEEPQPQPQQQPPQQESKPDFLNFDASQVQVPQQQQPQPQQAVNRPAGDQVGLAMIPENDFSKLNINGFGQQMNFNNFHQSVNAFAVTDVPQGPDPVDLLAASPTRLSRSASPSASNLDVLLSKLDGAARSLPHSASEAST